MSVAITGTTRRLSSAGRPCVPIRSAASRSRILLIPRSSPAQPHRDPHNPFDEGESMSKVSRRQFISTAAGATAVTAFPHVWIRPAWAQTKEVRVLAWTHFVPSYDKYFDAFAEQWSTKNGVKVIIDHVAHLQI